MCCTYITEVSERKTYQFSSGNMYRMARHHDHQHEIKGSFARQIIPFDLV